MMTTAHRYVLRSFLNPFLASFSVALFILTLQFLGRYQQDIFGKGFGGLVIAKLFMYASVQLVVLALPISMLMATLMTFGKMGETYELTAFKSSGISLLRLLKPLIVLALCLSVMSYYLAWEVIPRSNLKLYSLLYDASQAKPAFALQPGFFNGMIPGYSLYVGGRDLDGTLRRLKIYDHTENRGNTRLIVAEWGTMEIDPQTMYLNMNLYNGCRYDELPPEDGQKAQNRPFSQIYFDALLVKLDVSDFGFKRTDEQLFQNHYYMMGYKDLRNAIDSFAVRPAREGRGVQEYLATYVPVGPRLGYPLHSKPDTAKPQPQKTNAPHEPPTKQAPQQQPAQQQPKQPPASAEAQQVLQTVQMGQYGGPPKAQQEGGGVVGTKPNKPAPPAPTLRFNWADSTKPLVTAFPPELRALVLARFNGNMNNIRGFLDVSRQQVRQRDEEWRKHKIEFHYRLSLPLACIMFLFIGAPLGAIIRKGGLGMPTVVSTLFVIVFYILMSTGKKMAQEGAIEVWQGMWLPIYAMLPLALLLTYQSSTDSKLLNISTYTALLMRPFWRLVQRLRKKK